MFIVTRIVPLFLLFFFGLFSDRSTIETTTQTTADAKPELLLQTGHAGPVTCSNYCSLNQKIITGSTDNTAKIWDANNGKLLFNLQGHLSSLVSVQFSSDGTRALTASDENVLIWNTQNGQLLKSLDKDLNLSIIESAQFSLDNKYIIVSTEFEGVIFFDNDLVITKQILKPKKGHIRQTALSLDGKLIATFSDDNIVRVWNIEKEIGLFEFDTKQTSDRIDLKMSFDPKTRLLALAQDTTFWIWNIVTGKQMLRSYSQEEFTDIEFDKTGSNFLVCGKFLTVWNTQEFIPVQKIVADGEQYTCRSVEYNSDGTLILAINKQGGLDIFSVADSVGNYFNIRSKGIDGAFFTSENNNIVSFSYEIGRPEIWHIDPSKRDKMKLNFFPTLSKAVSGFSYCEKDDMFITLTGNQISVWSFTTGERMCNIQAHDRNISQVKFSPNGDLILVIGAYETVQVFQTNSGKLISTIRPMRTGQNTFYRVNEINYAEFSPDNKLIAICTNENSIQLADAVSGKIIHSLSEHKSGVKMAKFSQDGRMLASIAYGSGDFLLGTNDQSIKLWDVKSGDLIYNLEGHERAVESIEFGNENQLLSSSHDGKLKIWDLKTGKCIRTIKGIEKFSLDSSREKIIGHGLFNINVWDLKTNKSLFSSSLEGYSIYKSFYDEGNKEVILCSLDSVRNLNLLTGRTSAILITSGEMVIDYLAKKRLLVTVLEHKLKYYDLNSGKCRFELIILDKFNFIWSLPDGKYLSTPDAGAFFSWRKDNQLYDFDQWDLQYNRPDKVLQALGNTDTTLIKSYREAYYKRLRKMQVDTSMFNGDFHVPDIEILNAEETYRNTDQQIFNLKIKASDSDPKNYLRKLFVTINGNPIYGTLGMNVGKNNENQITLTIPLTLSEGFNVIKVSCLNNHAVASLKQTVYINYEPKEKYIPKTYYIGIGVSDYQNPDYKLNYAVKDVSDISVGIKKKYPEAEIHLLTNKDATRENIKALKKDILAKTNVDDIVIISFSGHGVADKKNDFYYGTYDISFDDPAKRGLSYDDIEWLMDSIPARKKLVLMDACHSGELDKESFYEIQKLNEHPTDSNIRASRGPMLIVKDHPQLGLKNSFTLMQDLFANVSAGNGATVISAAAGTEFAYEGNDWHNGVFTYCILQGLQNNKADGNGDKEITVNELKVYVGEEVQKLTNGKQKPTARQENLEYDWRVW